MERYNVEISDEAYRQLGECVYFIKQNDIEAAERLHKKLIDSLRTLESMPNRYPYFSGTSIPSYKYHKMFVEKYYLILYQIKEHTVYVEYVLDCRRDYSWLIQ